MSIEVMHSTTSGTKSQGTHIAGQMPPAVGKLILVVVSAELGCGVAAGFCRGIGAESGALFLLLAALATGLTAPVLFAAARAACEDAPE